MADSLMMLIQRYFPRSQWENAYRVAMAESTGDPNAHATKGEDSRGLFQINVGPGANTQYRSANLYDPETNVRTAAELWKQYGWGIWTTAVQMGISDDASDTGGNEPMAEPNEDEFDRLLAQIDAEAGDGSPAAASPASTYGTELYPADRWAGLEPGNTGTQSMLDQLIATKGKPERTLISDPTVEDKETYEQIPNPNPIYRYQWPDGTYVKANKDGQILGGTALQSVNKTGTGSYSSVSAPSSQKQIAIRQPDGSVKWEDNPNYTPSKSSVPSTVTAGNTVYAWRQGRDGSWALYPELTKPAYSTPEEAESARLDIEAKRLAIAKAQRDALPLQLQALQNYDATIAFLVNERKANRITMDEMNAKMALVKANLDATMRGTTPWQIEEAKREQKNSDRTLGNSILNNRVQTSSTLANSILQGALGANLRLRPGESSLGIDPFAMATDYVNQQGGGAEMGDFAKALVTGAQAGGQGQPGADRGWTREDILKEHPELGGGNEPPPAAPAAAPTGPAPQAPSGSNALSSDEIFKALVQQAVPFNLGAQGGK
jgi:hypothetical protein